MSDRDRIDPETLRKVARQAEEERLFTMKDDSIHPPPTIGAPAWQSLFFGSLFGQPTSRFESTGRHQSTFQAIGRLVLALAIIAGFFLLLNAIFS